MRLQVVARALLPAASRLIGTFGGSVPESGTHYAGIDLKMGAAGFRAGTDRGLPPHRELRLAAGGIRICGCHIIGNTHLTNCFSPVGYDKYIGMLTPPVTNRL